MGYSIFSHSHLQLVGCKTNGRRRMVLINYILHHKPQNLVEKNVFFWIFSNSVVCFLGLSCTSVPLFTWVSKINCCKYQLRSSAKIDRAFIAGGIPQLFIDIYYTFCPSVVIFDKNLSYQQMNKLSWHIFLQQQNLSTWSLKFFILFSCISKKYFWYLLR